MAHYNYCWAPLGRRHLLNLRWDQQRTVVDNDDVVTVQEGQDDDDGGDDEEDDTGDLPWLIITWRADVDAVGGRLPFVSEPPVGHAPAETGHW